MDVDGFNPLMCTSNLMRPQTFLAHLSPSRTFAMELISKRWTAKASFFHVVCLISTLASAAAFQNTRIFPPNQQRHHQGRLEAGTFFSGRTFRSSWLCPSGNHRPLQRQHEKKSPRLRMCEDPAQSSNSLNTAEIAKLDEGSRSMEGSMEGEEDKCRIDGVYRAAKCLGAECGGGKQPRAMSTLFIVEELTTDDGLQLTGQDLREARTNWVRALRSTGDSFVLELVSERLAITTLWAVAVAMFFSFAPHDLNLRESLTVPEWPYELLGGFLSILLVFRTDQSYERFWEGRSRWSELVAHLRTLTRLALASYTGDQLGKVLAHLAGFPVIVKQHLRGERNLQEIQAVFDTFERCERCDTSVGQITSANNMPLSALTSLSKAAAPSPSLSAAEAIFIRERVEDAIASLSMVVSECEKIKRTPIPLAYSRNTSRFFTLFCLTLPFPLLHDCPPYIVPFLVAGFSWILYATEEIGHVIEQPFDVWESDPAPEELPELEEAEIRAVFDFFDSCDKGQIDKTEFFQAMLQLGVPTPAAEVEKIVDRYDTNGNQMLEFPEFRTLLGESLAERRLSMAEQSEGNGGPAQLLGGLLIEAVKGAFRLFGESPRWVRSSEILPLSRYCRILQLDILQQAVLVADREEKERYMAMAGKLDLMDTGSRAQTPRFDSQRWE